MDGLESNERVEIFSKVVRAGKRTYFFDVKTTKANDYYLTVTESKKRMDEDGKFRYEKHKLFLYKEDFEKFTEGLTEAIDKIKSLQTDSGEPFERRPERTERTERTDSSENTERKENDFTNIDFEDLGEKE